MTGVDIYYPAVSNIQGLATKYSLLWLGVGVVFLLFLALGLFSLLQYFKRKRWQKLLHKLYIDKQRFEKQKLYQQLVTYTDKKFVQHFLIYLQLFIFKDRIYSVSELFEQVGFSFQEIHTLERVLFFRHKLSLGLEQKMKSFLQDTI